ncbi:MAG: thiol:disulfide interchange protein DsbA/DsbL [Arenimonas sp.]
MLRRVLIALSFLLPLTAVAQPMAPGMPRPGIDYEVLQAPQPTLSSVKGKIEVVEVFSYACPHCAHFQPLVTAWKKKLPGDVNFIYLPSVGQGSWERFARGFYAAESKKIQVRSHDALFKAIFEEQKLSPNASMDEIAGFYAAYGVDKNAFLDAMMSTPISAQTEKSKLFTIRTGANSTPTVIVAGKYKINGTPDRGFEGMIKTIDFIVAKERAAMKAPKLKVAAK